MPTSSSAPGAGKSKSPYTHNYHTNNNNTLPSVLVQTPDRLISEKLDYHVVDDSEHLTSSSRLTQHTAGRASTSPLPSSSTSTSASAASSSIRVKGRVRSRTSTISYTPPLAPVMSRENSLEEPTDHFDVDGPSSLPGPSSFSLYPLRPSTPTQSQNRKASKSVSNVRPNSASSYQAKRAKSYHSPSLSGSAETPPMPSLLSSPTAGDGSVNPRTGLKRRISTPSLAMLAEGMEGDNKDRADAALQEGRKKAETRARSTSTSIVIPPHLQAGPSSGPTSIPSSAPPFMATVLEPTPPQAWQPRFQLPSSTPDDAQDQQPGGRERMSQRDEGILTSAYNFGESSILRLAQIIRPSRHAAPRRRNSSDSEKGLEGSEEDNSTESYATRTSDDSVRKSGKYWGIWNGAEDEDGYFSLPPTPPDERPAPELADFEAAIRGSAPTYAGTLPTPALSTRSLSRNTSNKRRRITATRDTTDQGWLSTVYRVWAGLSSGQRSGKTGEVLRELGWTVGLLVGLFFVTAALALWMIQAMPITQLKHLPKSTTDLQLLSAEIRTYMASNEIGWWHTVGVLTFVGCWKHAWSVPGAVVLNILVGSVFEPMPALLLLTIITATGSLFSYLLSRPLAPLIAVLFPKPLALVRVALAPDSVPAPPTVTLQSEDEKVTAIQISDDPAARPIGNDSKVSVWRRLLLMRAMGFVPWSGMNVACGVVGVDWKVFWLTTAAGSASWSYVTASVGNILSRLAIPPAALDGSAAGAGDELLGGESLTSLLRDPVLIAKLVFLSGLTLLPVVLKRRNGSSASATATTPESTPRPSTSFDTPLQPLSVISRLRGGDISPPMSPTSPLTKSLARFTPTPAVFDLLSFGRTAVRHAAGLISAGVSVGISAGQRVVGGGGEGR